MTMFLCTLKILLGFSLTMHGAALIVSSLSLQDTLSKPSVARGLLPLVGLCEVVFGLGVIPGG